MNAEIGTYSQQIRLLLFSISACLDGLGDAQLNWRPPIEGANSAYVITTHTLGNARAWVLGIACGRAIERDRPAEFRASGGDTRELVGSARDLAGEIGGALAALSPRDLDRRLVPPRSLWGEGEPHEISVREALLHVVEHASIHLGQLQITRDWALQT